MTATADALMAIFGFKRVEGSEMKTDRELLELAAKAAGLPYVKPADDYDGSMGLEAGSENPMRCVTWDPLQDSSDALWLAVRLRLKIYHDELGAIVEPKRFSHEWIGVSDDEAGDRCAATRRAIVRAAAAIGERMK